MTLTNYVAYLGEASGLPRIGSLDIERSTIQPLAFTSGTLVRDLYQVIEAGESNIAASGEPFALSSVKLLPPISGRDVLAVGKNYSEHAKEFNSSGYDSSDKVDIPSHPVIFTKRATSIIASGEEIYPHSEFTESLDYEGEIGVIVGKAGFRISEQDAMEYVWGYTIINDMTARERQRDHKQFYIGKSGDTFCPMGPIAVPAKHLPAVLELKTVVNGEPRQKATSEDLIFSIPRLIATLSEGITIQPGDVIATGTPAGVGIGKPPPVFLKSGDTIEVSITGLGTLKNKISSSSATNATISKIQSTSSLPLTNHSKSSYGAGLTQINGKPLYYKQEGTSAPPIVFITGLGGTVDFYTPLIRALKLSNFHQLHLFDLEGQGLSPTHPLNKVTILSFAADVKGIFKHAKISEESGATLIAHSLGCLIAITFVLNHPGLVKNLILLGPPPSPLPEAGSKGTFARAAAVREDGMLGAVDAIMDAATSTKTKEDRPVAYAAVRMSLMGQDPEGYAKACMALGGATERLEVEKVGCRTLIVTGSEDKVSPPAICEKYGKEMGNVEKVVVLEEVGHWHCFEDVDGVAGAVGKFLGA